MSIDDNGVIGRVKITKSFTRKMLFHKRVKFIAEFPEHVFGELIIIKLKNNKLSASIKLNGSNFEVFGGRSVAGKKRIFVYKGKERIGRIDYVDHDGTYLKFDNGGFAHIEDQTFYKTSNKAERILRIGDNADIEIYNEFGCYKENYLIIFFALLYWVFIYNN